jgi:hypothetical protein
MHCVLPETGTHVPKHVAEAHVMFVLIKNVHLVGIINGVRWYKNAWNDNFKIKNDSQEKQWEGVWNGFIWLRKGFSYIRI